MTNRQLFWSYALKQWQAGLFNIADLWPAYEKMRDKPIAGAHFVGKLYGDC